MFVTKATLLHLVVSDALYDRVEAGKHPTASWFAYSEAERGNEDAIREILAGDYPDVKYERVAHLSFDDPEKCFQLTQHVDFGWDRIYDEEIIRPVGYGRHRSTSVGDLVQTAEGVFVVASFGFKVLDKSIIGDRK